MKFPIGISFLILLLFTLCSCSRSGQRAERSSLVYSENDDTPRDSVVQSYFSDEYSIHIFSSVYGKEFMPIDEDMWMVIYNDNGQTIMIPDGGWYPDLEHGVTPLEPEWPDYFLVHVFNLGNCCTCAADYLLKVTADEIKVIGEVNGYKDGKFYVNICHWPPLGTQGEMTLTKHEVPLINDKLHYPDGYNI